MLLYNFYRRRASEWRKVTSNDCNLLSDNTELNAGATCAYVHDRDGRDRALKE